MAEETIETAVETADLDAVSADHEKCTKQFAQNVERNVKFHSNQQRASLFFAGNALQRKEGIRILVLSVYH